MANARLEDNEVSLRLSNNESKLLIAILRRIGGDPHDSLRGTVDNILATLQDVVGAYQFPFDPCEGEIYLSNEVSFEDLNKVIL